MAMRHRGLPAILTRYGPKHQPGTDLPAFPVAEDGYLSLTPNQIADYLADPSRFYVRHVLRFPSPPSHQMVYGISVHAALEYFYTEKFNGRQPDLSKMLEVFRSSWRSEGFVSLRHEVERRKQGEVNLSRYFAAHIDALEPIAAVEKEFNLTIEEIKVNIRGDMTLL
jgi:hypothetical protein